MQGLRGSHIQRKVELLWALDRQISRLRPLEYPINIPAGAPTHLLDVWSIAQQRTRFGEVGRVDMRGIVRGRPESGVDSAPRSDLEMST